MFPRTCRGKTAILLLAFAAGCGKPVEPMPSTPSAPTARGSPAETEGQVRAVFEAIQAAIKAKDADKVWDLLSSKSRDDAEQAAKSVREAYEKADPEGKAKMAKDLGLPGEKMAKLTGKGFLETKRPHHKLDELSEGKVTKVTVGEDGATVYFDEIDGDHEKCRFLREDGRWKAWVTIPKPAP